MRARQPDSEGFTEVDGVKIAYETFGDGATTVLLMPTWTIVHARMWKAQVPHLARSHTVVAYDGPGNGRSDRPLDPAAYDQERQVRAALAVLDATGTESAVVVALSKAARWALQLAADHPDRVRGVVFIAPSGVLAPRSRAREHAFDTFYEPYTATEGWAKWNVHYWRDHYADFVDFFMHQCFSEPHSTKQVEDTVGWALETSSEVLAAEAHASHPEQDEMREMCARVTCPVLVLHGDDDHVTPLVGGEMLAEATRGALVVLEGSGHIPLARDPVAVNLALSDFVRQVAPAPEAASRRTWTRGKTRRKKALYISSPIGLGHARRDVAVAQELRALRPDLEVDWLAQHPVTRVLADAGETVHPASAYLANESAHIESESAEHDLHCFSAWRRMDEILVANFMMFHDVVTEGAYDLVIGDEAWDVDYYLHENPDLKRFAYAWFTDFVGWLPMPDGGAREQALTADYNAEMIEHIARYPRVRDLAMFVGEPDDVVPDTFGPDLPAIRDWTEEHFTFPGYVTGFDPDEFADRDAVRAALGWRPDEAVCVVTVGGSGVGGHLLRRVVDAYPQAKALVPGLRMVVVAGPRLDPGSLSAYDGLEVHAYVPDLYRQLAACDLAIVQGGLTTAMELTATGRPFVYVPLRHHFEQSFHVDHRLRGYGAGRRLDFADATPDALATVIGEEIGRPVSYRPVARDGAARAAALLAELV